MTPVKRLLLLLLPVIALLGCSSAHVEWTSYEDLAGKRIGMLTSRGVDSAVRESFTGCQILFYEDLPGLSLALEKQQIDAFVCMREGSDMMLERHPHFRILPGPGIPDSSAVGFRPDDILLAGEFNAFLSGIRADGTFDFASLVMEHKKPYVELIVGIHNIFKIFHIEYVRRMNYIYGDETHKWGIRGIFRVTF